MKRRMWTYLFAIALMAIVGGLIPMSSFASSDGYQVELQGFVDSMPSGSLLGQWQVAGVPVTTDALTLIGQRMGTPAKGVWVEVQGLPDGNGGILAQRVKVNEMKPYTELKGILDAQDAHGFTLAGIRVLRDANTLVLGPLTVGSRADILYQVQPDGSLLATQVRMEGYGDMPGTPGNPSDPGHSGQPSNGTFVKFQGTIQSMATGRVGTWVIGGRRVTVAANTWLDEHKGVAKVGASADVEGIQQANGSILASRIEIKRDYQENWGSSDPIGTYTKLYGTVQSLPANGLLGAWVVNGQTVNVTAATLVESEHGTPVVGTVVEVRGYMQSNHTILADKIEVKSGGDSGTPGSGDHSGDPGQGQGQYVEFHGQVQALPAGLVGTWMVSGRVVRATAQTRFEQQHGALQVGARVKVSGYRQADGSINATKIETENSHDGGDHGGDGIITPSGR